MLALYTQYFPESYDNIGVWVQTKIKKHYYYYLFSPAAEFCIQVLPVDAVRVVHISGWKLLYFTGWSRSHVRERFDLLEVRGQTVRRVLWHR